MNPDRSRQTDFGYQTVPEEEKSRHVGAVFSSVAENYDLMKADLEKRTGLTINRVEVGKIDFLNDTAMVRIYYFADEQEYSDYHVQ